MNTTIDLMLLASIAGAGIFIGLVTVLAILLILKQRRTQQPGIPATDTDDSTVIPTGNEAGRRRVALAVLISGVLLLSLGLPAVLLALTAGGSPPAEASTPPPPVSTAPPAEATPTVAPETPPTAPPVAEPEPEKPPQPAAPDNFVVSSLQLTPAPDSGHNWYRASVNIANIGSAAGTLTLTAKAGDRLITPQQVSLGGGDNVTLELKSLAREIGFLATMYENGVIIQRRHEIIVQNLRETLVFEYPARLESNATRNIIQPDWEMLSHQFSDVETLFDAGVMETYRMHWQVMVRSNTEPHRVFTITLTILAADGEIVRQDAFENNALPRWDTRTFSGFITLTAEEKARVAGYRVNLLCTSGCGEVPD